MGITQSKKQKELFFVVTFKMNYRDKFRDVLLVYPLGLDLNVILVQQFHLK